MDLPLISENVWGDAKKKKKWKDEMLKGKLNKQGIKSERKKQNETK
jgi:hypothetical protein